MSTLDELISQRLQFSERISELIEERDKLSAEIRLVILRDTISMHTGELLKLASSMNFKGIKTEDYDMIIEEKQSRLLNIINNFESVMKPFLKKNPAQ